MAPKKLGETVKRWRERRGLTQEALARRAKVHRVYLALIETQAKTPSLAVLERLAKALKVKVADLLKD